VLAVIRLLVTLIFNTVGVWAQWKQIKDNGRRDAESRLYTQIGVLTQLARDARSSERSIEFSNLPQLQCKESYTISDLTDEDYAAMAESFGVYDFMAWLFNEKLVVLDSARDLWGRGFSMRRHWRTISTCGSTWKFPGQSWPDSPQTRLSEIS
jgi:hypothetical protein